MRASSTEAYQQREDDDRVHLVAAAGEGDERAEEEVVLGVVEDVGDVTHRVRGDEEDPGGLSTDVDAVALLR